jgi:3-isopropylmalate dehydratase small subunit
MRGKCWKFGADINTDLIIPGRYLNTTDPHELSKHCMEDLYPQFATKVQRGDVIVADKNFGCGSSREHAPIAIKSLGVSCIIAKSFARIFYRNAFNVGLPVIICHEAVDDIAEGDEVEVNTRAGTIKNIAKNKTYHAEPIPSFIHEIIAHGGLMSYVTEKKKKIVEKNNYF